MIPLKCVEKSWGAFNWFIIEFIFKVGAVLKLSLPIIIHDNIVKGKRFMHAEFHVPSLDDCSNNLLDKQTLEWLMSLASMATAFDSYISVGPHACDTLLKYFPINQHTEAGTIMADVLHTFLMHILTKYWLEFEFVPECPIGTLIHIWQIDAY